MTSVIAMTSSRYSRRFHRRTANLWPLSTKRGVLLGTPNEDSYIGPSVSSLMAMERKSRIEGNESTSYDVSNNATVNILSSTHIRFGLVLER